VNFSFILITVLSSPTNIYRDIQREEDTHSLLLPKAMAYYGQNPPMSGPPPPPAPMG